MTNAFWLRMNHPCDATGCYPGDILRLDLVPTAVITRMRDGADLAVNPGLLALALANGWVEVIPSLLRAVSA